MQEMHECNGNEEGNCGGSCEHQHRCQPHREMHECDDDRGDDGAQGEHHHHDQPLGEMQEGKENCNCLGFNWKVGEKRGHSSTCYLLRTIKSLVDVTMLHVTMSQCCIRQCQKVTCENVSFWCGVSFCSRPDHPALSHIALCRSSQTQRNQHQWPQDLSISAKKGYLVNFAIMAIQGVCWGHGNQRNGFGIKNPME